MTTTGASVNVPMNTQQRDKDIENKLRLYGIYQAFANKKVPSNKQIDVALNSFINSKQLRSPNGKLSDEGKVVLADFRDVVEKAKSLLLSKNSDELLQEFIWHTTQLGAQDAAPGGAEKPSLPVSKDAATRDKEQALDGIRTLGRLIVSNGQFRKLLNDAQILFRDIAGDAASNAARRINPTQEQLEQIDRPAEDNVWHDAPDFSKDNLKQQLRENVDRNKPVGRQDLSHAAGNATQAADPHNTRNPREVADRARQDEQYGSALDPRTGLKAGVDTLRDSVRQNVPDEHRDRVKQKWGNTRDYMGDKFHEDRRKQTIWRLKKMVVEIQGHPDYQQAVDTLLNLAENYTGHAKSTLGEGRIQVGAAHQDDHLKAAEESLKELIERFANYTSLDDILDSINDIYRDADRDPELKSWFRQMDSYVRRCLKTEGYILTDNANSEWQQLSDQGRFLLRDRYRDHTDRVMNEFQFFSEQFAQDEDSQRLGQSLQKLFNDLGNDENGKPVFKKHLVKDLTQVIIPDIFENIRYVPIPRIEYSDPMMDAIIENLVIESNNLMPNVLEISNDSHFKWGRVNTKSSNRQAFMVHVSGIQCDLRDVSYYIKRKQGFPSITDTGIADFFLGGQGLSFALHLSSVTRPSLTSGSSKPKGSNFFRVDKVDVNLSNLSIKLKQSNHKLLFNLFKPLLLKVMKPALTKIVEKQVKASFGRLDGFCYRVYQEQERAKRELANNPDPENAQNMYRRYADALKNELLKKKQKAESIVQDKEMRIAVTKDDSLPQFKNISLPGGISTKATEYKNMAAAGDRWHSDVFSIGNAHPSTNVPGLKKIERRSPHAHTRSIRERPQQDLYTQGQPSAATTYGNGNGPYGTQGQFSSTIPLASNGPRASRDSGYHAPHDQPLALNAGQEYADKMAFGDKINEGNVVGTQGEKVAGQYTLSTPQGKNPMLAGRQEGYQVPQY
ncbi:hypothetical protein DFH27DRAFT_2881 [Peziza echinospora]|nr:hypothetical protein DFH27DRAFT_2881 [Peziza echinospora]